MVVPKHFKLEFFDFASGDIESIVGNGDDICITFKTNLRRKNRFEALSEEESGQEGGTAEPLIDDKTLPEISETPWLHKKANS